MKKRACQLLSSTNHPDHLDGTKILAEKRNGAYIYYNYGADGISGFTYNSNEYVYRKNVQGDVTHIYQVSAGSVTLVGQYNYNAWGLCTTELDTNGIATLNPFRYRGYYYDISTGLYYLESRYYDAEACRFINADAIEYLDAETVNGLNLYAYCGSDPINRVDPIGNAWWHWVIAVAVAVVVVAAVVVTAGAAAVALGASASVVMTGAAIGGAIGAGVGLTLAHNAGYDGWELVGAAAIGGLIGGVIGAVVAPAVSNFLSSTFTFSMPTLTMTSGGTLAMSTVAVSVTGAQIAGVAGLIGVTLFAKGYGPRMGHNQHENKQFDDAMKKLGIKKSDPRWREAHDALQGEGPFTKFKELIDFFKNIIRPR